jgi:hypothetical protein
MKTALAVLGLTSLTGLVAPVAAQAGGVEVAAHVPVPVVVMMVRPASIIPRPAPVIIRPVVVRPVNVVRPIKVRPVVVRPVRGPRRLVCR